MIIGNRQFDFERHVYVMGILNVTPDSFSDGGMYLDPDNALEQALRLEAEGADVLDLGAESTRPGSEAVSEDEERRRLMPVLRSLLPRLRIPISIDTQKAAVAQEALSIGASMINDISSLGDPDMASVVSKARVPVVLMHKKGEPKTMQDAPHYEDVLSEVCSFLERRVSYAESCGIRRERILIDPGLGFGKRFEDNLVLLRLLGDLKAVHQPIVIGASRKSLIRRIFGEAPERVLAGSVAAALMAAINGAGLIRAHDVAATKAAIDLAGLA